MTIDSRQAIVSTGAEGALVVAANRQPLHIPAPRVQIVDATGAGDSVAAVIAAALARRPDPGLLPRVVELAVATASRVVQAHGALTGLPTAAEARVALNVALAQR